MWFDVGANELPSLEMCGQKARGLLMLREKEIPTGNFGILDFNFTREAIKNSSALEAVFKRITQSLKNWGTDKFAIRASLEFGDEHLAAFSGNLSSINNVEIASLKESLLRFIKQLSEPQLIEFFKLHSGNENKEQRMAIIIQEMISVKSAGIFFNQSPTLSSGLHYIEESDSPIPLLAVGAANVKSYWCDQRACIWKKNVESVSLSFQNKTLPTLLEIARKLQHTKNNNFNFEWVESTKGTFVVLNYQAGNSEEETVNTYTAIPLKKILAGPCSSLTTDIFKSTINDSLNVIAKNLVDKFSKTDWIEFYGARPFLNLVPLKDLLIKFGINADFIDLEVSEIQKKTMPLKNKNFIANALRLWHIRGQFKKNKSGISGLVADQQKIVEQHKILLESIPSSKEAARLLSNLSLEIRNFAPALTNEILLLAIKEILYTVSNKNYPELPFFKLPHAEKPETGKSGIYLEIEKLALELRENEEFVRVVKSFLAASSKTGQSGDIYYWLRENGFQSASNSIHKFLSIFGKTSFFDRRIESPSLSLSPTTFFNILLSLMNRSRSQNLFEANNDLKSMSELSAANKIILNSASELFFKAMKQREEVANLIDEILDVFRLGLRKMSLLLQAEAPKLFPDSERSPDLTVIGINVLRDYGAGSFGPDVLAQLMIRGKKEQAVFTNVPDIFFHKKSEGDPYFTLSELRAERGSPYVVYSSDALNFSKKIKAKIKYVSDPLKLIEINDNDSSTFLVSDSPIEGLALFLNPNQIGIFSQVGDSDWTGSMLSNLGVKFMILNQIPDSLKQDGQDVIISLDNTGRVEIQE